MEAEISGAQRKVLGWVIKPARSAHGDAGIPLKDGKALPFQVTRQWSAPAGHYVEAWYLVHPETREVLYEGGGREVLIWGLQSPTELKDEVDGGFSLGPGKYLVVFALGGLMGGQTEVEATEVSSEAA